MNPKILTPLRLASLEAAREASQNLRPSRLLQKETANLVEGQNHVHSINELKSILTYDEVSGIFFWKKGIVFPRMRSNRQAGSNKSSYVKIKVGAKHYQAHRLAWLFYYGAWPKHQIDHIDRNKHNNRISNLREATPSQNSHNKQFKLGMGWSHHGVKKCKGKFRCTINNGGKKIKIGVFNSLEEAINARMVYKEKFMGMPTDAWEPCSKSA